MRLVVFQKRHFSTLREVCSTPKRQHLATTSGKEYSPTGPPTKVINAVQLNRSGTIERIDHRA